MAALQRAPCGAGFTAASRHTCRRHARLPPRCRRAVVVRAAGQEAEEAAQHSVNGSSGGGEPTVTAADLRALQVQLERQQQAQAQALQLIQDQQRTIATLEARLERARAPTPLPPSKTAGSDSDSDTPRHPLDGPEAVLEPTALERPLAGSGRYKATGGLWGAGKRDLSLLPKRIILVRHAQSKGNVDPFQYTFVPDPSVPLTSKGWQQAIEAGEQLRELLDADGTAPRLFTYCSPYLRCKQTTEGLLQAFAPDQLLGVQEEVMLREQDFGNFQDAEGKKREKLERLRYGRFFYRFPHGESGADVYNRMTILQDHLVRDMEAGRYGEEATLLLVTHGLAARIFLQRWFHWTVEQFLAVWNPQNATPIVMERIPLQDLPPGAMEGLHTKALYRLAADSADGLNGCTQDMCHTGWTPRGIHWGDAADAAPQPEDGSPELQQSSVAYQ